MTRLWDDLAARAGLRLTPSQHARLSRYLDVLLEANRKVNLTRIVEREAAEVGHVGDALTLLRFLPGGRRTEDAAGRVRLADVGSGGGVPGIPLAIARPDVEVVLIEATRKKALFLEHAAQVLELSNVTVMGTRAEQAGHSELRETFDVAVARGVRSLDWLAEWLLPLVKVGGRMLAMKGPRVEEELRAGERVVRRLGGGKPIVHPAGLPGVVQHVIVEIPKVKRTDARYPRAATLAKGKPLGPS